MPSPSRRRERVGAEREKESGERATRTGARRKGDARKCEEKSGGAGGRSAAWWLCWSKQGGECVHPAVR